MKEVKTIIPMRIRARLQGYGSFFRWVISKYPSPAPRIAKQGVLARYGFPNGTWVESGTYLGDTTRFLSKNAIHVYTIEPSVELAAMARKRFARSANVEVIEGLSEEMFPTILSQITGDVSFWLDGHASGGMTHVGAMITPIRVELDAISSSLGRLGAVTVLVDDFRGFTQNEDEGNYPPRSFLVKWAEDQELAWTVEHDIFVAWRESH